MRRERTEVQWQAAVRGIKVIWRCLECGNHIYVYAQRDADYHKRVA